MRGESSQRTGQVGPQHPGSNVVLVPHILAIAVITMICSGCHRFVWNFTFTSSVEKTIWRVTSCRIFVVPCIFIVLRFRLWIYVVNMRRFYQTLKGPNFLQRGIFNVRRPVIRDVVPISLLARIMLLVEAPIAPILLFVISHKASTVCTSYMVEIYFPHLTTKRFQLTRPKETLP